MKQKLIKFALWLYTEHIQEDWDDYNMLGKILIYPAWVVRSTLIWIFSPFFILSYKFSQSEVYKAYQEFGSMSKDQMAEFNKIQKQNFLNKRYRKGKR